MAIELPNPLTSTTTVTSPLVCDRLYVVDLHINGSNKLTPSASISLLPYADNAGSPVYASDDQAMGFQTADLFSAAANVPQIGAAIEAVFAAAQAWSAYRDARKADWDAAASATAAAAAALAAVPTGQDATAQQAAFDAAQSRETVARLAWLDPANPPAAPTPSPTPSPTPTPTPTAS